jgi:hypothetical protein
VNAANVEQTARENPMNADRWLAPLVCAVLIAGCLPRADNSDETNSDASADATPESDTEAADGADPPDGRDIAADTSDDIAEPDADASETEGSCGGSTCGANAVCNDDTCVCKSGYTGDPYDECVEDPMSGCSSRDDCGAFALCVGGSCECEPGFQPTSGDDCERPTVDDPAKRSKSRVCQRWNGRTSPPTSDLWETQPSQQCDPGTLTERIQWEGIEYTNLHRWLVGLDPVTSKPSYVAKSQECATVLAAKGTLSHQLESSDPCYTEDAGDAARSANLAAGVSTPAASVPRYLEDSGTPTLGHRRWIHAPSVGAVGFGHRGRYGCMYVIDRSGTDSQTDVFYPAPGPFPRAALHGVWSYSSDDRISMSNASVDIEEVSSGDSLSVQNTRALDDRSYGRVTTLRWEVPDAKTGVAYRVTISGLGSGATKSYETTLVNCP